MSTAHKILCARSEAVPITYSIGRTQAGIINLELNEIPWLPKLTRSHQRSSCLHNLGYTLSLCDIDPATIKIDKFDFHKDIGGCDDPGQVSSFELNCTSAEVEFHTWNAIPKIKDNGITTFANLTGKDHEAKRDSTNSKGWFIVDEVAYAERFAKALKHAVELCGGKQSKF